MGGSKNSTTGEPARGVTFQLSIGLVLPLADGVVLGGEAAVVFHLGAGLAKGGELVGGVHLGATVVADALAAFVARLGEQQDGKGCESQTNLFHWLKV